MPNDHITSRGESAPVKSELDSFLEEVKQLAGGGKRKRTRPYHLRPRRHTEPGGNLGHSLQAAGGYVP
jgi:hypothetical protein